VIAQAKYGSFSLLESIFDENYIFPPSLNLVLHFFFLTQMSKICFKLVIFKHVPEIKVTPKKTNVAESGPCTRQSCSGQ